MPNTNRKEQGFRILEIVFGAFLVISAIFLAKDVELTFFPVVDRFSIETIEETEDGISIQGEMNKVRPCKFKELMVYINQGEDQLPHATTFSYDEEAPNLNTRADIEQSWGPWGITIPGQFDLVDVQVFSVHSCHALYDTVGRLHSFSLVRQSDGELEVVDTQGGAK